MAVSMSPSMNSLPSSRIFFTSLPLMVMLPSSSTSAPGMRLMSSSMAEPSGVRMASGLNTSVSLRTTTCAARPVTTASFSMMLSGDISSRPSSWFW